MRSIQLPAAGRWPVRRVRASVSCTHAHFVYIYTQRRHACIHAAAQHRSGGYDTSTMVDCLPRAMPTCPRELGDGSPVTGRLIQLHLQLGTCQVPYGRSRLLNYDPQVHAHDSFLMDRHCSPMQKHIRYFRVSGPVILRSCSQFTLNLQQSSIQGPKTERNIPLRNSIQFAKNNVMTSTKWNC